LIGFGEAAMAFAEHWGPQRSRGARAFDIKSSSLETAGRLQRDYQRLGVRGAERPAEATHGARVLLSLVTPDQALAAAESVLDGLAPNALYCDFNSVAPQTKQAAARLVESVGGRYVDVAVMAPVRPARLDVPLLVSGPHACAALEALGALGFSPQCGGGAVGDASTVKMLRSVVVKGMEALTSECFLAASAAGVTAEVARSLNGSWPGIEWAAKADYDLDRMIVHGLRRAAEMEEAVATLEQIGTGSQMSRATVAAQRAIGSLRLQPVNGLGAKARLVLGRGSQAA
jgi:3-hydroxyisobutyrate dehydrogenase-like beta-hydroxyacid dehydrogenase